MCINKRLFMNFELPKIGKAALSTRHQAFLFRAAECVREERVNALEMLRLRNQEPAIGYETDNHDSFS